MRCGVLKILQTRMGHDATTRCTHVNDRQWRCHSDLRRTRAAGQSIIPVDTELTSGISRLMPELKDKFKCALSCHDAQCIFAGRRYRYRAVAFKQVNEVLFRAIKTSLTGVLGFYKGLRLGGLITTPPRHCRALEWSVMAHW